MTSSRSRIAREWCLRRFWSGYAYKRHALAYCFAQSVSVNHVGIACNTSWCTSDNDDQVAFFVLFHVQQRLIHGKHHLVGGVNIGAEESLRAPRQSELGTNRFVRSKYQ